MTGEAAATPPAGTPPSGTPPATTLAEEAARQAAATKAATDAANAAAGTKTQGVAFGYDPAGAETVFGKPEADGRPANIPAKYWDPEKKIVKGDVVFNQLKWAEGKLGAKLDVIGGPADGGEYKINVPAPKEGEDPWEIPADDPAVKGFLSVAKRHDVSQKFVDEVIAEVVKLADETRATNSAEEIKKLGKDGIERVNNMSAFLKANLPPEQAKAVTLAMMTTANSFTALETLIRATGAPTFVPRDPANQALRTDGKMSVEEWNKLNFEEVEQGGRMVRRRAVDPEFNKRVEELRDQVFGTIRRDASGRPVTESGQPIS